MHPYVLDTLTCRRSGPRIRGAPTPKGPLPPKRRLVSKTSVFFVAVGHFIYALYIPCWPRTQKAPCVAPKGRLVGKTGVFFCGGAWVKWRVEIK